MQVEIPVLPVDGVAGDGVVLPSGSIISNGLIFGALRSRPSYGVGFIGTGITGPLQF